MDHLFYAEDEKKIYYAELKANINLDTEKSKSTYTKCLDIVKDLVIKYPEYEIKWCLLGYRYIDYNYIPKKIKKKYSVISENLFGINQYLTLLNINHQFTEDSWKDWLNEVANYVFNSS
jgi:enolase